MEKKDGFEFWFELTLLVTDDAERCELFDRADTMDCVVSMQWNYRSDVYWLFGRNIVPDFLRKKKKNINKSFIDLIE